MKKGLQFSAYDSTMKSLTVHDIQWESIKWFKSLHGWTKN
jgi:hypothetical protein